MISLTISNYHVLEKLLGGGGMGVVSEPEDLKLGRHVRPESSSPERD
jgi:hypothetical protein